MKNEWKVAEVYAVYRLKDINEPDQAGNREYLNYLNSENPCILTDKRIATLAAEGKNEKGAD